LADFAGSAALARVAKVLATRAAEVDFRKFLRPDCAKSGFMGGCNRDF
jgi:hypothetical protein